ncbi:MAG: DNA repair protein RadA [Clostridia bacterium]|nr:DNA repair protein RadA [Clostridia bacterium]
MKQTTKFVCQECGYSTPKWLGKCPTCGNWNTFHEEIEVAPSRYASPSQPSMTRLSKPKKLSEINTNETKRTSSGILELDRVLGGGIVKGSLVLVGGDPGIGKSTLLLQICEKINSDKTVLYVSGEESAQQLKLRASRLKTSNEALLILAETELDTILNAAMETNPEIMVIDSIQTVFKNDIPSAPGTVTQVREATHHLMRFAKENDVAIFIVGHMTKDGNIAGPRMLEHMVDCVLYFEGERTQSYRILRTVKNRFGSTNEIGVFEMKEEGLVEVKNPSQMLLDGRPQNVSGSTVVCTLEGSRPILAEVQALCSPTGFGNPRRMATGIDYGRSVLLTAILEKQLGYPMQNNDVYINVVGGIKLMETATDLAIIVAIASNIKNFIIDSKTIILGEVGLTSEVRTIGFCEQRINEAAKMGFDFCILPEANAQSMPKRTDIKLLPVKNVADAIRYLKKIEQYRMEKSASQ